MRLKRILAGAGSVLDIYPSKDYSRFIPTQTPGERMQGHWLRVGQSLQRAMGRFEHEQQPTAKSKEQGSSQKKYAAPEN